MTFFSFAFAALSFNSFLTATSASTQTHDLLIYRNKKYSGNVVDHQIRGGANAVPTLMTKKLPLSREAVAFKIQKGGEPEVQIGSSKKNNLIPISFSEMPQFLSMSFMMFLFIYVFTTVRDTKDTLLVSNCGAESIPFLKLYAVTPSAALFIIGYSKLSNMVGTDALFFITLIPFFIFYTVFAFVLYPIRDKIHDVSNVVTGAGPIASLIKYWSFSLYFIVSELWASAGVPLLFWSCANNVTPLAQAKRFYPLFAVIGNFAPIVSGKVMSLVVSLQTSNDDIAFGQSLKILASIKLLVLAGICILYYVLHSMVKKVSVDISIPTEKATKKKNLPLAESMKELSKSVELRSIASMVVCYNICIELTEVLWKGILRKTYPNKSDYMTYMANFSQIVGAVAIILQLCASSIINGLGWKWTAMITPLSMCAVALPFFFAVASHEKLSIPLSTVLLIGTIQNVISKVTKYTLFDPCKEMAFIPLGPEAKVKGKAGVDVIGARLGRSIGSATQQLLVLGVTAGGSILECAPSLGILYVMTVGCWSRSVNILGGFFKKYDDEDIKDGGKSN